MSSFTALPLEIFYAAVTYLTGSGDSGNGKLFRFLVVEDVRTANDLEPAVLMTSSEVIIGGTLKLRIRYH